MSTPVGEVTREVVDQITKESISWNSEHGITGMLLSLENRYFQFLEGEEKDVMEVFDMIKGDPRHTNVIPQIKGFSNDRVFSEWCMGAWMLSNAELNQLPALSDLNTYLENPVNSTLQSKKFISMMKNLLQTWMVHEPERSDKLKNK